MPKELPVPDDMRHLIEKRGGNKDRRKKTQGRISDEDEGFGLRRSGQKDRRNQKNYRDLLNDDEDE